MNQNYRSISDIKTEIIMLNYLQSNILMKFSGLIESLEDMDQFMDPKPTTYYLYCTRPGLVIANSEKKT